MTHDTQTADAGTEPQSGANDAPGNAADDASDDATDDAFECAYCGRLFAKKDWLALHRGIEHEDRLNDAERDAYEEAYAAENEELRLFRLKALAVLVLLYFVFVMAYAAFA